MWRRRDDTGDIRQDIRAVALMLMSMDQKLDDILREVGDEDGWEEEETD